MKSTTTLEYQGKKMDDQTMITKSKELWIKAGNKLNDIKTINLYAKPNEYMIYCVINDNFYSQFAIE